MIDVRSLASSSASPHAAPGWVAEAAWLLPETGDVHWVELVTRDGATWVGSWMVRPVYFCLPDGIRWDDVTEVRSGDEATGSTTPHQLPFPVVHCPFEVPSDRPTG